MLEPMGHEDLIESIKADQCVNFEANYATLRLS